MSGSGPTAGAPAVPGGGAGERAGGAAGRVTGDPVREVMAAHRVLCERAVDPLEIAAGLEEAGLGAAAAARCRHTDLFSLAEELYARVPRRPPGPAQAACGRESRWRRCGAALRVAALAALPCAAAAALGAVRPVLLPAAVPLVLLPALAAGADGSDGTGPPDRAARGRRPVLLAHGLGVAGLLLLPLAGAPGDASGDGRVTAALVLAAALSAGSAEWAARWFRHVGRGHLGSAGTLAEFRSRMRPVLPVAVTLHLAVLAVLTFAALAVLTAVAPRPGPDHGGGLLHVAVERADGAQWAAQGVLGLLLVLPALLARCGRSATAALGALAGPVLTAALLATGRSLPAAGLLGGGAVALVLFGYASVVLGRAGAHR
ncbi:hypothetical protein ACFVVX_12410 [Kitasatospora sp. NPDC058170]|uniref:hypothetical protein n=1 Tax=Kitasatospora sp. NPDC058170 TaxID=3346364 RepID=UPI0036DCB4AE